MKRKPLDEFDRPWLVLCEGPTDRILIQKLLAYHGLDTNYDVQSVIGRGQFGNKLSAIKLSETFDQNVKALLIVSDKDDNPSASFREVQDEIRKAGFPVPHSENEVLESPNFPKIIVLMVPIRGIGNLETLAILAMNSKWGLKTKIDGFIQQTPAANWTLSKLSKCQMEITLAVTCEPRPDVTFASHWDQHEKYHLPIEHYCFEEYVSYFRNFAQMVGMP